MSKTQQRRKQIAPEEILDLGDYERKRDAIRAEAIAARGLRRVEIGPNATLSFENRQTVAYQIQEMLRAERIAKAAEVQHEIETYSDLLPTADELSATLMFEFPDPDSRAVPARPGRFRESSYRGAARRLRPAAGVNEAQMPTALCTASASVGWM